MKKHIVIAGKRQVGKSTLVNRLLTDCDKPVYGFRTAVGGSLKKGYRSFFIHPASCTERSESEENHIGDGNGVSPIFYTDVFDSYGVSCLEAKSDGIIVMDELGFMENEAELFKSKVLECLDGDIPVIATAKAGMNTEFLNAVLNHPNADVYYIDEQNRDSLYEELKDLYLLK
ncbi:MAG: hypothetical protein KBS56_03495 [Clostridiales bacterium]|nr:hypothetical protein [Candidatus Crickella equi]